MPDRRAILPRRNILEASLALTDELTESGRWLFGRRSYLPLALVALFIWCAYRYPAPSGAVEGAWTLLCSFVSGAGLAVRAATVGATPGGTSGRSRTLGAEVLNTTGAYSMTRHPLYLGNFLMGLGVALYPRIWWLVLIFALAYWLYYERIMLAEEAFLQQRFGQAFASWASATPAFVPNPRLFRRPTLPFSLRAVLRREYNGAFAIVVLMAVLEAAHSWGLEGRPTLGRAWLVSVAIASALWLLALAANRGTSWLDVAGR